MKSCKVCQRDFFNYDETEKTSETCEAKSSQEICTKIICSNSAVNTECIKISNCLTTFCYNDTSGSATYFCNMCHQGYYGTGTFKTVGSGTNVNYGYQTCTKGELIQNCNFYSNTDAGAITCYSCKEDFAVDSTEASCISYTADKNCRR